MKNTCPQEETIADYLQGSLSDEQKIKLETHFSDCKICLDELAALKIIGVAYNKDKQGKVSEKLVQNIMDLIRNRNSSKILSVVRQIKRSATHMLLETSDYLNAFFGVPPRLQPVRGPEKIIFRDLIRVNLDFQEIKTMIEIEKINDQHVDIRVTIMKDVKNNDNLRVTLRKKDRDLLSYLLDPGGTKVFSHIPYGCYAMVFSRNGKNIGIYPFEIKETPDAG